VVGWVSSGITDMMSMEMHSNPSMYENKKARLHALGQYPSQALKAPSFLSLHVESMLKQAGVKKQYWQMLKRMYGSSDRAVSMVKRNGPDIVHATKNMPAVEREGLKASQSPNGLGVFFGSPKFVSRHGNDTVRLKRPSELLPQQKYPSDLRVLGDKPRQITNFKNKKSMPTEQFSIGTNVDRELLISPTAF